MSIIYCEKHDRRWDSDRLEDCPLCESAGAVMTPEKRATDLIVSLEAQLSGAIALLDEIRQLWPLIRQLQDGCRTKIGESRWTEWDRSVVDRSVAMSFKLDGEPWVWHGEKHPSRLTK